MDSQYKPSAHSQYCDVYICDAVEEHNDFYFISETPTDENAVVYSLNRAGICLKSPKKFYVKRNDTTKYCQLFCVLSGKGELFYRGKHYNLKLGDLCIMKGRETHAYSSDASDPIGQIWMEFYGGNCEAIVGKILQDSSPIFRGSVFNRVVTLLSSMITRLEVQPDYQSSLYIYEILLELLNHKEALQQAQISQDVNDSFVLVEAYINAHIAETISNQTLADICGISLSSFINNFKKIYRTSPQHYIMKRRIAIAKTMLLQPNSLLDDVSEALGFCSTSYFIRCFKKYEGVTPLQYKQQALIY